MIKKDNNKKINVLICLGTRPEGIKLAPIIKLLDKKADRFKFKVCSSGQHKEMLKQVFDFFDFKPDFNLNLMTEEQSLGSFSSKLLNKIDAVLEDIEPDIVLIQGDTATAFLIALAAFYRKIKVGHVEAGLRTKDKFNPFPEEINRQLISRVADLHFAPTRKAYENLIREEVIKKSIFLTGNTIVDAVKWGIKKISKIKDEIELKYPFNELKEGSKVILVTMHRRESFGKDIKGICNALSIIANKYKDMQIVYPVHLNPNVRKPVFQILGKTNNIILTNPLDYESFIWLMNRSYFIITDSGGVQEEAPALNKPVLVIRKKTERTESLDLGISRLVGTDENEVIRNVSKLIEDSNYYKKMISNINPYGDGHAADKIMDGIYRSLN